MCVRPGNNNHMDTHAEQILQSALSLPPDDRIEIAESLLLSLDPEMSADVEAAWGAEIKRRIDEIDSRQAKMIPWDEAIRSMREKLNG